MKHRKPQKDDWETPKEFYDQLNQEFNFDFDPCPLYSNFNGLDYNIKWGKRNFVNPPYSRKLKEQFIIRAFKETFKGNLSVCLLPVSTSTKIFHEYIYNKAEIRFIKGRIKFSDSKQSGQFDSMLVIFKPK